MLFVQMHTTSKDYIHIMTKYVFCLAFKYRLWLSNIYTELFLVILEAEELSFNFYC